MTKNFSQLQGDQFIGCEKMGKYGAKTARNSRIISLGYFYTGGAVNETIQGAGPQNKPQEQRIQKKFG